MSSSNAIKAGAAYVELFLKDNQFQRGLTLASKRLKAFGAEVQSWGTRIAGAGAAVTTAFLAATVAAMNHGDALDKMRQKTGMGTDAIQGLALQANLAGTDIEAVENGVWNMQRSIQGAAKGSKQMADAFALLGLKAEDFSGLTVDQQFKLLADRMSAIQSPSLKTALAMQIFGRRGRELIPILNEGSAGMNRANEYLQKMGAVMSKTDIKAAAELNDTLDVMWMMLKRVAEVIGSAVTPIVKQVAEWIIVVARYVAIWLDRNRDLIRKAFLVAAGVTAVGTALVILGTAIVATGVVLASLATIFATVTAVIGMAATALSMLLTPIGMVIAAVVALAGYTAWSTGAAGNSIQWLSQRWEDLFGWVKTVLGGIRDALKAGDIPLAAEILWLAIKVAWMTAYVELLKPWEKLKTGVINLFRDLWYGMQELTIMGLKSLIDFFIKFGSAHQRIWENITSFLTNIWDGAVGFVADAFLRLRSLVDSDFEYAEAKKIHDKNRAQDKANADKKHKDRLEAIGKNEKAALEFTKKVADQTLANMGADNLAGNQATTKAGEEAVKEAEKTLADLKAQLAASIAKAAEEAKNPLNTLPGQDQTSPVLDTIETLQNIAPSKIGVAGTFNVLQARGLAAGGADDRLVNASERTADNTDKIAQVLQNMQGGVFGAE